MTFTEQPAQVCLGEDGCSVMHMGRTYPPAKVLLSGKTIETVLAERPSKNYRDFIVSGTLNSKDNEIIIREMQPR